MQTKDQIITIYSTASHRCPKIIYIASFICPWDSHCRLQVIFHFPSGRIFCRSDIAVLKSNRAIICISTVKTIRRMVCNPDMLIPVVLFPGRKSQPVIIPVRRRLNIGVHLVVPRLNRSLDIKVLITANIIRMACVEASVIGIKHLMVLCITSVYNILVLIDCGIASLLLLIDIPAHRIGAVLRHRPCGRSRQNRRAAHRSINFQRICPVGIGISRGRFPAIGACHRMFRHVDGLATAAVKGQHSRLVGKVGSAHGGAVHRAVKHHLLPHAVRERHGKGIVPVIFHGKLSQIAGLAKGDGIAVDHVSARRLRIGTPVIFDRLSQSCGRDGYFLIRHGHRRRCFRTAVTGGKSRVSHNPPHESGLHDPVDARLQKRGGQGIIAVLPGNFRGGRHIDGNPLLHRHKRILRAQPKLRTPFYNNLTPVSILPGCAGHRRRQCVNGAGSPRHFLVNTVLFLIPLVLIGIALPIRRRRRHRERACPSLRNHEVVRIGNLHGRRSHMKDCRFRVSTHLFSRLVRHGGIVDADGIVPRREEIALLRLHRVAHRQLLRSLPGDDLHPVDQQRLSVLIGYGHVVRADCGLINGISRRLVGNAVGDSKAVITQRRRMILRIHAGVRTAAQSLIRVPAF